MSADGQYVAFHTNASNLNAPAADDNDGCLSNGYAAFIGEGTDNCTDVYVHDRSTGGTTRVSVGNDVGMGPVQGNCFSHAPEMTPDGQFIFFETCADNLGGAAFAGFKLYKRDRLLGTSTVESGVAFAPLSASSDGRFAAYFHYSDIVPPFANGSFYDVYLVDTLGPDLFQISVDTDGDEAGNGNSTTPVVSPDGRYVAFFSSALNLVPSPPPSASGLYLRDRQTNTTSLVAAMGSFPSGFSADGRYLAFASNNPDLVADDGNGLVQDTFVYDLVAGTFELVSKGTDGTPGNANSYGGKLSADGRFVVFLSSATVLAGVDSNGVSLDTNGVDDIFVCDRLTGVTTRVSRADDGSEANGASGVVGFSDNRGGSIAITADGSEVAFASDATNLLAPLTDTSGATDVFVRAVDPGAPTATDITGDGDLDDVVLGVLDGNAATPPTTPTWLCPAADVAVAAGRVAFLRPERSGAVNDLVTPGTGVAGCDPGSPATGGIDLNGDMDADDQVVTLWRGGATENLGLAASAIALSATHVAAVSGTARVHPIVGGTWTDTGQSATTIGFCGSVLAFIRTDGVLGLHDPGTGQTALTDQQATEFVCNENQVAFRTSEADQAAFLNGDDDQLDDILQVWDLSRAACVGTSPPADCLANSGYSVRPCRLEACDPRIPYRVGADAVRFLTFECDEGGSITNGCAGGGTDLNGNTPPYAGDLIIQSFNVRTRVTTPIGTVIPDGTQTPLPPGQPSATSGDEQSVFTSNGRCVEVVGGSCTENGDCVRGEFCDASTCKRDQGVCVSTADCPPGAACTSDPIVAASPDTDADGVPDHLDNCPRAANADQTDGDQDGVGDACDAFCAGGGSARDKVTVKTVRGVGLLSAKLTLPLAAYEGEPVTVRIDDADSAPVVQAAVATVPPSGDSGKKWLYKSSANGLQRVSLVSLEPRRPGEFKVKVKARRWFSAAQANGPAAETHVTVLVGTRCFTSTATVKVD